MLDFYALADDASRPDTATLSELSRLGGLEYETYERLIQLGSLDARYDFYGTFRWGTPVIRQIRGRLEQIAPADMDSPIITFCQLLDHALAQEVGILAIGD